MLTTILHLQLIQTEPAMLFDSVHVFARGLEAASLDGPELRIRFGRLVIGSDGGWIEIE